MGHLNAGVRFRLTRLLAGRSLQDLTCAALACTHEAEAASSSSPACPRAWDYDCQKHSRTNLLCYAKRL